jgi:hypothetical protein
MINSKNTPFELITLILIALLLVGCHKKMAAAAPPPPPSLIGDDNNLQESLFKRDQAVLSNQDIDRILNAHLTLENRHRMAVLGEVSRWTWSEELSDLETQNTERLLQALRAAPQLSQVRYMPSLLVPERRTVPYLREAAARFQSDLLLIYVPRLQTFQKSKLLASDEARARCIVEAVLLDVRTGIVTFTTSATEGVFAKKSADDVNFSETVMKAETDSQGKALVKMAGAVVAYLRDADK